MNIFKHDPSEGRPLFTNQEKLPDKPVESSLTQNPLLNRIKPAKNPSRLAAFFRRSWANFTKYFTVKQPDAVKESMKNLVRSQESDMTELTVGNIWHHYEHFLKEDSGCPPGLKSAFNKMEQSEKEVLNLSRVTDKKLDKAKDKLIKKTTKDIKTMPIGDSRLFLLQRAPSDDQSIKGDLFCTISHTKNGYVLSFTGSGDRMDALQKGFPLAGKEKSARILTFEPIDKDIFKNDDFLSNFITDWIEPRGVSPEAIIDHTKNFIPTPPASLEDYATKSKRPDKLFWNIVLSLPQKNTKATLTTNNLTSTRSIRLRTELLTLYEAFDETRIDLDPKSREFKSLNKLLENVSGKVLTDYQKGYLSDQDFMAIAKRLKIIDTTLKRAKSDPSQSISSHISIEKPAFPHVSLKTATVDTPQVATKPIDLSVVRSSIVPDEVVVLSLEKPLSLQTYNAIDTKEGFLEKLASIHALKDSLENGSPEEQKNAANEIFRFFHEVPLNTENLIEKRERIPEAFLWQLSKDESLEALKTLVEITESIVKSKKNSKISQYDFEALSKLYNISVAINAHRTGFWIGSQNGVQLPNTDVIRAYTRFIEKDLFNEFHLSATFIQVDSYSIEKNNTVVVDDYALIIQQKELLAEIIECDHFTYNVRAYKHWVRPIDNAFLAGLYQNAISDLQHFDNDPNKALPEAFFDNPEEAFRNYMDLGDAEAQDIRLPGNQKELKALSRLLRVEMPQWECFGLIKEYPHLLYDKEIRNYFDAIFFDLSLGPTIRDLKDKTISLFPKEIEAEITKLQSEIELQLFKDKVRDPDLLTARLDLMLYYHEMLIRLKSGYEKFDQDTKDFPDSKNQLEKLCSLCKELPLLNPSLGYASRLLLRTQLEKTPIETNMLGAILNTYVDIKTSFIDPKDIEPYFEKEMQLHWPLILSQLKTADTDTLIPLLNRLCSNNGVPTDSAWNSIDELIFQNDQVEIDLKTLSISLKQTTTGLVKLPQSIIHDPFIKEVLSEENLTTLTVLKEEVNNVTVYSFVDSKGIPTQIEDKQGVYSLYRELTINQTKTWLLAFDLTPKPKANDFKNLSLFSAYSLYKESLEQAKIEKASVSLFQDKIFIDPNNKYRGYAQDPSGKITFQVKLKQKGDNLSIDKVWDYRELPASGPWELHNAALLKNKSLNFLKGFENKDAIILWSQKGKLKKVELPRYGLKFDLEGGKLLCRTPEFDDYFINPDKNDFNLAHGLILEHPTKGKKILLGDADALDSASKKLNAKAKGFGNISLALHQLGVVADLIQGILPKVVNRKSFEMDKERDHLHFTSFDLRPHTGEICQTKNWPIDLLHLIKHEAIENPLVAASRLDSYPLNVALTDQKLLGELIKYCNSKSSTGAEAAIKLKLSLNLLKTLSANNRLKKNIKTSLIAATIENGKIVLSSGRRVPGELQLTEDEKLKLLSLIKKKDPQYTTHMAPHLLDSNTSFDPLNLDTTFIDDKIKNWKPSQKPVFIEKRIEKLEEKIFPNVRLADDALSVKIDRLNNADPLLFTADQIQKHFTTSNVPLVQIGLERSSEEKPYETVSLDAFQEDLNSYKDSESLRNHQVLKHGNRRLQKLIDDKLTPKQEHYETEIETFKNKIEKSLRNEIDPSKQMALIANKKRIATFEEIRLALIQGKLNELQNEGMIPASCNLDELENQLIGYFDALARRNATSSAISLIEKMKGIGAQDTKNWNLMSKDLHRLLTLERKYDPKINPRLLIFEAQLGLNLKELDGGLSQLDLLEALLSDPNMLVQAPTGAGKSAVLSILESLLKSNGNNLVVQKVLPPLYNQAKDKAEDVIGDLFHTLVMPLRFNLKMRLTKNEIAYEVNDKGIKEEKTKPVSIFKAMYEELLEVMTNQGCILTDYTSIPMMEAKFLQLGQELVECSINGTEPTALQLEHYTYLRKILVLHRNKGLESMDEFDQPNRPIQKIQLDLQMGSCEVPAFYIDTTLEIYDILGSDPILGLDKNIQSDISETAKNQAIQNAAKTMAKRLAIDAKRENLENGIADYLLGINDDVTSQLDGVDPAILDKISFCMNQLTQFIPLSLNAKEGSRYGRSADGSKTVPAQNGQKHDAKHGTLYEQINYTVQDYRQKGIQAYDLKTWFKEFKTDWDRAEGNQKAALEIELEDLFPSYDAVQVSDTLKSEAGLNTLISIVNQDQAKVAKFLIARLQLLKSSGYLISMDPTNVSDQSRAASGISATSGDPDSLPEQFKQDRQAVGQIKASMAYRMMNRALDPDSVLAYDPEHPELALNKLAKPATAIIDGSGAFNDSTKEAALSLLAANNTLKQVAYHEDETIVYEGVSTGSLAESGFVFNQAHTRGTDILLARDAHALLTVNEKEGFRGFAQEEGRLRGEGQTFELAMPQDQKAGSLVDFITQAECVDSLQDAKDIYRHATQEIRANLRNQMMNQLLACEDPKAFIELFKNEDSNALFITKPEKSYTKQGTYFADNHRIQRADIKPEDALNDLYAKHKKIADTLGLELEKKDYSSLLAKMPSTVSGVAAEVECELQVEVEQDIEVEVEAELELELEQNQELDIDDQVKGSTGRIFPARKKMSGVPRAPISNIHQAYDPKIFVTENFLPYERNKTHSKFKREAFQPSMFNIGAVHISVNSDGITNAVIDDPLYDPFIDLETKGLVYDIRLGKVTKDKSFDYNTLDFITHKKTTPLEDFLQSPEFHSVIVQIKFLDGRTSGYSEGELIALKQWLLDSGPEVMKKHFLDEVLRYRYREKSQFANSQLGELFRDIM